MISVALYVGENVLTGQLVHTDEAVAEKVPALQAAHVMSLAAPSTGDAVPERQLTHGPPPGEENVPVGLMSTNSSCCVTDCMNPCVRFAWESSALILWGGDVI